MSFGVWVMKKTPTPFERISRTVWVTDSMNALLAPSKSRCASSKKKHQLRLVEVADLGQLLEQLGQQPHERSREQLRLVLHGRQLEARDDPPAVGSRAQQVVDLELRIAEELVAAALLEPDERAQQHADGLRREPADPGQLGLALVRRRGT